MYKPGDVIKYRVLIIDSEMKPYKVEKVTVELIDSFGDVMNKVETKNIKKSADDGDEKEEDSAEDNKRDEKEIGSQEDKKEEDENSDDENKVLPKFEAKLELGVISGQFPISSLAIMGLWGIRVKSIIKDSDQNAREEVVTNQKFEIKEYVLPRFEVFVEANRDVKQSENSIRLTVYANYTFGEFVNGKATIIAKSFDTYHPDIVYHTTSKALDVEFKRMASFDIKNELKIVNSIRPYKVKFEVTFEETLTGQKMIKTIDVRVHKIGENTLELVSIDKRFKPGFPFKFEAIVRDSGGVLSTDKFTQVKVNAKYYYKPILCSGKDDSLIKELDYTKHEKLKYGVAKFTLIPAANTTSIAITAEFQDAKEFLNVAKHESRSREYLSIKSLTQK